MTTSARQAVFRILLNRNFIDAALFFLGLGLLWEFSVRYYDIKSYLLPSISDIIRAFFEARALLWQHTVVTFFEVCYGFGAAVVVGLLSAVLIYYVPVAKRTIYPLVIALQGIPKIGLAPIIVVWFGYGLSSKVIMAFLFALFPIVIATLGGLAGTPASLEEHFRALKASAWTTFWRLRVPCALPNFVDGCKVAIPLAVIGAVVGEFVGSNDGLGNLILLATGSSQTALSFAALAAVTLLSLTLFYFVEILGKYVWWRAR